MGILNFLFIKSKAVERLDKNTIYKKYYADYPEKPYISNERNIQEWLERAEMFPSQSLVSRNMMIRYNDGLLPGHIYMLYWLKKYSNKRIPTYFEYKYGISFEKEKAFLTKRGYLLNDKPTPKGETALSNHKDVIETQNPTYIFLKYQRLLKILLIIIYPENHTKQKEILIPPSPYMNITYSKRIKVLFLTNV